MSRYDDCLKVVLGNEGGTSNDPNDHGGLTRSGVTQAAYDRYRIRHGLPQQPVTMITDAELTALYFEDYWTPCLAGTFPAPVDLNVFDTAVNSGPGRAIMILQQAVGVSDDGKWGPASKAAFARLSALDAAERFCDLRETYLRGLVVKDPSQGRFLKGWINRVDRMRKLSGLE